MSKRKRDSKPVPVADDEPELDDDNEDENDDDVAAAAADDDRPACKYGATCFRKNPDHFAEYSHPHLSSSVVKKKARTDAPASPSSNSSAAAAAASSSPASPASSAPASPASAAARSSPKLTARQRKSSVASADSTPAPPVSTGSWSGGGGDDDEDGDMPAAAAAASSSSAAAAGAARPSSPAVAAATAKLPACPYGLSCFRKNLLHFSEYSHPIHGATTKQDSGSSPHSPSAGAVAPASSSSSSSAAAAASSSSSSSAGAGGGFTLQRSYSQLTESERKLLVLNALQEKIQLEAALKNKDTELAAKQKEAEHLKAELGAGVMLLPGEAEALAGDKVTTFTLHAQRTHEANASSMHFRLAESQFYRLLGAGSMAKVTSVEYVVSPAVAARFAEAKTKIKGVNKPVLAFHGTADANIPLITANGFKMPGQGGHKHATDTGWYGKGIYFSEYPAYSMGYIKGSTRLLLCQVLLGRVYKCTKLIHGASLVSGFDAHSSPDGKELVIFDSAHILPCYIVNFTNTPSEFAYASDEDELAAVTSSDKKQKHAHAHASMEAALVKKSSTALKSYVFLLAGKYDLKQAALKQLIENHAGQTCLKVPKSTDRTLCLLASEKSASSLTLKTKVQEVREEGGKIINQTFVYEQILNPTKTDISEYELDP